jgi:hypothetical protein
LTLSFIRIKQQTFLNSESFRDSTKLGITITTFAFPLLIAGSDYFLDDEFWRIIGVLSASTIMGLWNSFSLATLTNEDGKIEINQNKSNILPTLMVLQFMLMILALTLILKYQEKPQKKLVENQFNTIQYRNLNEFTKEDILRYWGMPTGKNGQIDHHFPVQIDHQYRSKLTTTFQSKLTT